MKLAGFINGAYTLDSVNVDVQRCVNLYPEMIQSGSGKGAQPAYLKATPGLDLIETVGDGPIRMIHSDANNRILITSGNKLYRYTPDNEKSFDLWSDYFGSSYNWFQSSSASVDIGTDTFNRTGGFDLTYFWTGCYVNFSAPSGAPGGLTSGQEYYLIVIDFDNFQLASTLEDASNGVPINITSTGSGTFMLTQKITDQKLEINHSTQIDFDTNEITVLDGHTFVSGDRVYLGSFGVDLPGSGLSYFFDGGSTFTYHFIKKVSSTKFKICTSIANVVSDTEVDLTPVSSNIGKIAYYSFADPDLNSQHVTFATSSGKVNASSSNPGSTKFTALSIITDGDLPLAITGSQDTIYYPAGGQFTTNPWGYIVKRNSVGGYTSPFSESTHVDWIDGYFILSKTNDPYFYVSGLNDITVDPLSFAASEGSPDKIMGHIANSRDLWLFNERSTEVFVNTGNPDFPFERVQGGFFEIGCVAANSIAKINESVFWLGRSEYGQGGVYMNSGLRPKKISTHAIEQAISGYADISTATAYTYQSNGHFFYVLNFSEATWVYDLATGLWHERAYTNAGVLERHRAESHAFAFNSNEHLIYDYENNNLYKYNDSTYTDGSSTAYITRLRSTPHYSNEGEQMFCYRLQLDMETGVGLVSGQGSDPQVMLDWSDDGGHTWSDESWTSAGGQAGGIGEYSTRVVWRRLGRFRDRIFRFKITDPVKVVLIDAFMKLRQGGH